jgi:hypothetical protein
METDVQGLEVQPSLDVTGIGFRSPDPEGEKTQTKQSEG